MSELLKSCCLIGNMGLIVVLSGCASATVPSTDSGLFDVADLKTRGQYIFVFRHAEKVVPKSKGSNRRRECGASLENHYAPCSSPDLLARSGVQDAFAIKMFMQQSVRDPINRVVASSCGRTRETAKIIFGDSITISTDSFDAKLRDDSNTSNRTQKARLHDVVVDLATDLRRNTNAAVVAHSTSVDCLDDQLGSVKQSGLGRGVKNCQEKVDGLDSANLNEGDAWIVDATSNPPIVIGRLTAKNWKSNRRVAKTEATTYCKDNL